MSSGGVLSNGPSLKIYMARLVLELIILIAIFLWWGGCFTGLGMGFFGLELIRSLYSFFTLRVRRGDLLCINRRIYLVTGSSLSQVFMRNVNSGKRYFFSRDLSHISIIKGEPHLKTLPQRASTILMLVIIFNETLCVMLFLFYLNSFLNQLESSCTGRCLISTALSIVYFLNLRCSISLYVRIKPSILQSNYLYFCIEDERLKRYQLLSIDTIWVTFRKVGGNRCETICTFCWQLYHRNAMAIHNRQKKRHVVNNNLRKSK